MFLCLKNLEHARTAETAAHWHTASEAATVTTTVTATATAHWHTAHRHTTHHTTHTGSTCTEEVQTIAGAEHDVTVDGVVLVVGTGQIYCRLANECR